jgi:hypothetical protein
MPELFFTKVNLLASAENEWLSTAHAGQGSITVLHATHFLAAAHLLQKCALHVARLDVSGRYPATLVRCSHEGNLMEVIVITAVRSHWHRA